MQYVEQTEDIPGMDFVLDLTQVSIFSSNPGDKALILWSQCFSVNSDLIKKCADCTIFFTIISS